MVGAGSIVTRSVSDNPLVLGNPARVGGLVCLLRQVPSIPATSRSWAQVASGSGWAKMARTVAAIISLVAPGEVSQEVAHQMHLAALPRGALEHPDDRLSEAGVGVGDDQSPPTEARSFSDRWKAAEHLVS